MELITNRSCYISCVADDALEILACLPETEQVKVSFSEDEAAHLDMSAQDKVLFFEYSA